MQNLRSEVHTEMCSTCPEGIRMQNLRSEVHTEMCSTCPENNDKSVPQSVMKYKPR
jgi:hypothetical protein